MFIAERLLIVPNIFFSNFHKILNDFFLNNTRCNSTNFKTLHDSYFYLSLIFFSSLQIIWIGSHNNTKRRLTKVVDLKSTRICVDFWLLNVTCKIVYFHKVYIFYVFQNFYLKDVVRCHNPLPTAKVMRFHKDQNLGTPSKYVYTSLAL